MTLPSVKIHAVLWPVRERQQLRRIAASHADIVSFTGAGRTLEDGHHHAVDWSAESIDERVAIVRDRVGDRDVVFDVLVQHVQITDDRAGVAERVARAVPCRG
jgi:hypothetical protein